MHARAVGAARAGGLGNQALSRGNALCCLITGSLSRDSSGRSSSSSDQSDRKTKKAPNDNNKKRGRRECRRARVNIGIAAADAHARAVDAARGEGLGDQALSRGNVRCCLLTGSRSRGSSRRSSSSRDHSGLQHCSSIGSSDANATVNRRLHLGVGGTSQRSVINDIVTNSGQLVAAPAAASGTEKGECAWVFVFDIFVYVVCCAVPDRVCWVILCL